MNARRLAYLTVPPPWSRGGPLETTTRVRRARGDCHRNENRIGCQATMTNAFMESDRLYYRGLELSDVETLTGWLNDPRIRKFLDHRVYPVSMIAEEAWVRSHADPKGGARSEVVF